MLVLACAVWAFVCSPSTQLCAFYLCLVFLGAPRPARRCLQLPQQHLPCRAQPQPWYYGADQPLPRFACLAKLQCACLLCLRRPWLASLGHCCSPVKQGRVVATAPFCPPHRLPLIFLLSRAGTHRERCAAHLAAHHPNLSTTSPAFPPTPVRPPFRPPLCFHFHVSRNNMGRSFDARRTIFVQLYDIYIRYIYVKFC